MIIDFDLVSTDELIGELSKRCDGMVFVSVKNPSPDKVAVSDLEYSGGPYLALGLCEVARVVIARDAMTDGD